MRPCTPQGTTLSLLCLLSLLSLASLAGCGEEEAGSTGGEEPEPFVLDAARVVFDRGASAPRDMSRPGGDRAPLPFDSGVREIESCEDICAFYEACGVESVWGADCLARCEEEADFEERGFRSYVVCLQDPRTTCESLSSCRLPPPPPLGCDEACERLSACAPAPRLPSEQLSCAEACEDETLGALTARCVEGLGDALCDDEAALAECWTRGQEPQCTEACEQRLACDPSVDLVDCQLRCLRASFDEDPLGAYNADRQRRCVANSEGSCEAIARCEGESGESERIAALCAADEGCGFFVEAGCVERLTGLLPRLGGDPVSCLEDALSGCDQAGASECFQGPAGVIGDSCGELCLARSLCGLLPEGESEGVCAARCTELRASDDPQVRSELPCAQVGSCGELTTCLAEGREGNPEGCEALCERRGECLLEEQGTCVARCEAQRGGVRARAEELCGLATSCEAAPTCELPPMPACEALCEPLLSCGEGNEDCALRCDDRALFDEDGLLDAFACAQGTLRCGARQGCEAAPESACRAWCTHQADCAGSDERRDECVIRCASRGEAGERGLALEVNFDAWSDANGASCEEQEPLAAPVEDAGSLCAAACEAVSGCGLEEAYPDCLARCQAEAGEEAGREALRCRLVAERRGEGCAGVARCFSIPVPEPTPDCAALCARRASCDDELDELRCAQSCSESPAGDRARIRCVESLEPGCAPALNRCFEAPDEAPESCVTGCAALAMSCPELLGGEAGFADQEDCVDHCAGLSWASEDPVAEAEQLSGCFAGLDPAAGECSEEALELCSDGDRFLALCEAEAAAVAACMNDAFYELLEGGLAGCLARAEQDPASVEQRTLCLEEQANLGGADPFACLLQLITCPAAP